MKLVLLFALFCIFQSEVIALTPVPETGSTTLSSSSVKSTIVYTNGHDKGKKCLEEFIHSDGSRSALVCTRSRLPPGSPCKFVPGNQDLDYPKCCPQKWCPPK